MPALYPPKNLTMPPKARRRDDLCGSCDKPINPVTGECAGCTGS